MTSPPRIETIETRRDPSQRRLGSRPIPVQKGHDMTTSYQHRNRDRSWTGRVMDYFETRPGVATTTAQVSEATTVDRPRVNSITTRLATEGVLRRVSTRDVRLRPTDPSDAIA